MVPSYIEMQPTAFAPDGNNVMRMDAPQSTPGPFMGASEKQAIPDQASKNRDFTKFL